MQDDDDGDPIIHVCQGPPACQLQGDAAISAQKSGCPWCKRSIVHDDGTETVLEPSHQ